jgi:hypothetical protein
MKPSKSLSRTLFLTTPLLLIILLLAMLPAAPVQAYVYTYTSMPLSNITGPLFDPTQTYILTITFDYGVLTPGLTFTNSPILMTPPAQTSPFTITVAGVSYVSNNFGGQNGIIGPWPSLYIGSVSAQGLPTTWEAEIPLGTLASVESAYLPGSGTTTTDGYSSASITNGGLVLNSVTNINDPGIWSSDNPMAAVPEPSTLLLYGLGLVGLVGWRWRRK